MTTKTLYTALFFLAFFFIPLRTAAAQLSWQIIQMPTRDRAFQLFADPPSEYGPNIYYELNHATAETIPADLDRMRALGFRAVTFQAGREMSAPFMSPGYLDLVKVLAREATRRDLRLWIVDDAGYPSGFAGGKFSAEAPSLRMAALTISNSIDLTPGMEFEDVVAPDAVSAIAYNLDTSAVVPLKEVNRHIRFTPPAGRWRVLIASHVYRTSLTRSVTNPTGAKDETQSLENYLDPAATRQYLNFVHEEYRQALGEEFGKTVLGFRGDEPDFSFFGLPYAPAIFTEFKRRKGYDIQPIAAALLLPQLTPELQRMAADYADVWSALFSENFFRIQAEWCRAHSLEYQVHLNHEDDLPRLAATEGDFLRNMTTVQVPGIDTIWHQIWPGVTPDFPKLASSAAHLGGHPRAFTESFAAYNPEPNLAQASFILNEQMVRGVNLVEVMSYSHGSHMSAFMGDPGFPALMTAVRRRTALLSQGRPATAVALYIPTRNFWMADESANASLLALSRKLLEAQYEFDYIDDDSLRTAVTAADGGLKTASGNLLRTVLVPAGALLTLDALHTLEAMLKAGGKVVFFGAAPTQAAGQTMLHMQPAPALPAATIEPEEELTPRVRAALPSADLHIDSPAPGLRYTHRVLADAEIYFLFNESSSPIRGNLQLAGAGTVEQWSAELGEAHLIASSPAGVNLRSMQLDLPAQASALFCVRRDGH
jgi:hypothetical protein